ncbi:MAG: D-alanine--D-alanine ligase [Bacteriovoracaceae bacterium]|nr:D-alanine--D-alanine ligase [Bacteriovoracaceae bacterium]
MAEKSVLLLFGGGSTEHEISKVSSKFIRKNLKSIEGIKTYAIELTKDNGYIAEDGEECHLSFTGELIFEKSGKRIKIDYAIPCLHGFPGETGDIQSVFELSRIPYFGCDKEASQNCFNKVTSKLWFDTLQIPNTPSIFLSSSNLNELEKARTFFRKYGEVFIKAASQGSSVGCYWVTDESNLEMSVIEAFNYSQHVLIEKALKARELEIAVYEYDGKIVVTRPGEIITPENEFYSYEEKYSNGSNSVTHIEAKDLTDTQVSTMMKIAKKAFVAMKLRHLARIDFFLTSEGEIYLNEVNTFPGMTEISMFPKMLENHGHSFINYLKQHITK